jgi:hypothetical protein
MNEQASTSPVMVNRIVISYVKMEAVAALPILFDTDVRHCATVSPSVMPLLARVAAEVVDKTDAIVALPSAVAMAAPEGPKL